MANNAVGKTTQEYLNNKAGFTGELRTIQECLKSLSGRDSTSQENAIYYTNAVSHKFDGINSFSRIDNNSAFSVPTTGSLSISAWIRPDTLNFPISIDAGGGEGRYCHFLGKGAYSTNRFEWLFRMYSDDGSRINRISFYVFNSTGGIGVGSYFQDVITPGDWIHIIGCVDATSTYIYKNGILRDNDVYTATITPTATTAPLSIGTVTNDSFFKGSIKDVIVFNKKLSDAEALALATVGTIPSGSVARYLCNDTNSTLNDSVGGLNGTITSMQIIPDNITTQDALNKKVSTAGLSKQEAARRL